MKTLKSYIPSILSLLIFMICLSFTSCSNSDEEIRVPVDTSIKLIVSKTEITPFEKINVRIDLDDQLVLENYDSIRWIANGVADNPFFYGLGYVDYKVEINLTDYRIGTHVAYVLGYKDGNVVSKDSVKYEVKKPTKDFFTIKWNQTSESQSFYCVSGFTPYMFFVNESTGRTRGKGTEFRIFHIVDVIKKSEYARMSFLPWTTDLFPTTFRSGEMPDPDYWYNYLIEDVSEDLYTRGQVEYSFYHNYLTELFGTPKFVYEGDDLKQTPFEEEYDKRFIYKYDSSWYPVEIWETPTSNICLLRSQSSHGVKGICEVVAQPR